MNDPVEKTGRIVWPVKHMTPLEDEIADLVGRGLKVPLVRDELARRGRHMAIGTLRAHIRTVAGKLRSSLDLPPMSMIRLWKSSTERAA